MAKWNAEAGCDPCVGPGAIWLLLDPGCAPAHIARKRLVDYSLKAVTHVVFDCNHHLSLVICPKDTEEVGEG